MCSASIWNALQGDIHRHRPAMARICNAAGRPKRDAARRAGLVLRCPLAGRCLRRVACTDPLRGIHRRASTQEQVNGDSSCVSKLGRLAHGTRLEADIDAARAALASGRKVDGDATMLPAALESAPAREVVQVFGSEFAASLKALPTGEWVGPVRSGFGLHLVKIDQRVDGRDATLADARDAVQRDLLFERSACRLHRARGGRQQGGEVGRLMR